MFASSLPNSCPTIVYFFGSLFASNIAGIEFNGKTEQGNGGAVYIDSASNVEFNRCIFEENSASNLGGALAIASSTPSSVHLKLTIIKIIPEDHVRYFLIEIRAAELRVGEGRGITILSTPGTI